MQYYGYAGKILYVDLTSGRTRTEPLDIAEAEKFLGGGGLGSKLFYDIFKPGTAPLSPDNPVVISAGPLVGTLVPTSNKIQMITKSAVPANQEQSRYFIGWSSAGSNRFGLMMKNAGYDQIVITGAAKKPVYLKIDDDEVEVCDARDLWGKKDGFQAADELMGRHKNCGVIAIGEAGENAVPVALCFVDNRNTIGRSGGATVMGAKKLKAIVVHGTKGVKVRDPKRLIALADATNGQVMNTPFFGRHSSTKWPLKDEWSGYYATEPYPTEIWENTLTQLQGCSSCVASCKGSYAVETGEFAGGTLQFGPFMLVVRYGRQLELKDYKDAIRLADVANRLGICYTTAAAMMRFVIKLYERGEIGKEDSDGLELKMGDVNLYIKLLEKIARREGIGEAMGRGWWPLSARVGVDADTDPDAGAICKGTSAIAEARTRGLGPFTFENMVSPRGMHNHPTVYYANQPIDKVREFCRDLGMPAETMDRIVSANDFNTGRLNRHIEDGEAVYHSLGVCTSHVMWQIMSVRLLAEFYTAVTGIEMSPERLKMAGERDWNLYKLLNTREGFTRADDACPGLWARSIDEPIKTPSAEIRLRDYFGRPLTHADVERMLNDYYDERGWDVKTGVPAMPKLKELGLEEFAVT